LFEDKICVEECPNELAYNKLFMRCDVAKFDFVVHYPSANNYITSQQDLKLIMELQILDHTVTELQQLKIAWNPIGFSTKQLDKIKKWNRKAEDAPSLFSVYFVIPKSVLELGMKYGISIEAESVGILKRKVISFETYLQPFGGEFIINPHQGTSLKTEFELVFINLETDLTYICMLHAEMPTINGVVISYHMDYIENC
jgi:hypothetical protein